jgi:hypothetical protein
MQDPSKTRTFTFTLNINLNFSNIKKWRSKPRPTQPEKQEPKLSDAGIVKKRPLWNIKSPFSKQKQTERATERAAAGIVDASSYSLAGFFAANAHRSLLPKMSMPKISMPKMSMPKLPTMALPRSHDPELRRSLLGSHNGGNYGATGITNPIANPTKGGGS